MKKALVGLALLVAGITAWTPRVQGSAGEPRGLVVGTFDSRGVLFAYVRSDAFQRYLAAQKEDVGRAIERARAEGDRELVAALEALGPAMQERIHRQGFGSAPVDDVLAHIEDRLPAIAEELGVDVIVSKWELVYSAPDARFVDVTERLATELGADEEMLRGLRELCAKPPVPLDQLKESH